MFDNPLTDRLADFLISIGLCVRSGSNEERTFLPGILIDHGALVIDEAQLKYPGDILHEAGHLAVMSTARRQRTYLDTGKKAAEEMAAIAWSYAALLHLQLAPEVVFHPDGYRGGSTALIENFSQGRTIGVPILQWLGLTADEKRARELGVAPYPVMIKWLYDGE